MHKSGFAAQHTLKAPIHCSGVGLHTGVSATVTLEPAAIDTGIIFRVSNDQGRTVDIPAHWSNVVESPLCTTLTDRKGATVMTIEHLMAALNGCGIDNAIVSVAGPEVPIMDGSAAPFVFLIECAGSVPQTAPRRVFRVLKTVRVGDDLSWASLEPADVPSVECAIDFDSKVIARQSGVVSVDAAAFKIEVSRARTFGFLKDVDRLRAAGRALGGSLDNVVVIDGDTVLNEGGLRYHDEFVRHKLLDAIGDLYQAARAMHSPGVCWKRPSPVTPWATWMRPACSTSQGLPRSTGIRRTGRCRPDDPAGRSRSR